VCSENNEGSSFNKNASSSILKLVAWARLNVGKVKSGKIKIKTAFSLYFQHDQQGWS
jgi:hypothetical protein